MLKRLQSFLCLLDMYLFCFRTAPLSYSCELLSNWYIPIQVVMTVPENGCVLEGLVSNVMVVAKNGFIYTAGPLTDFCTIPDIGPRRVFWCIDFASVWLHHQYHIALGFVGL